MRLPRYDYSSPGVYFVTVCIKEMRCLLGCIVGGGACDAPQIRLSAQGAIVRKYIDVMAGKYPHIRIAKYVIMPNHIHMLIVIDSRAQVDGASQAPHPTNAVLPKFVSLLKRYCNHEIGYNIFQRSYHDHIIRDEAGYRKIWHYIDTNTSKWKQDRFYVGGGACDAPQQ